MTITFPDDVAERIQNIAEANGYASAAEFLMELVEEAEAEAKIFAALPGPSELTPKNRAELEAMLEAGINSGPTIPDSPAFWAERRRVLAERMAKRKGGAV